MFLEVEPEVLERILLAYGEVELAARAGSLSDDEFDRIGALSGFYAFSDDALALGGSIGGERAIALASVDVLDPGGRDLRGEQSRRPRQGIATGLPEGSDEAERIKERELRLRAARRQISASQPRRVLDVLDPPAWDPAPLDATDLTKRCHALRTKSLRRFSDEDLRIMIDQQIAPQLLVGRALTRLRAQPLLNSGHYAGDLLASVLGIDPTFWEPRLDPEVAARKLAERIRDQPGLEPALGELVRKFIRDHPRRSVHDLPNP